MGYFLVSRMFVLENEISDTGALKCTVAIICLHYLHSGACDVWFKPPNTKGKQKSSAQKRVRYFFNAGACINDAHTKLQLPLFTMNINLGYNELILIKRWPQRKVFTAAGGLICVYLH